MFATGDRAELLKMCDSCRLEALAEGIDDYEYAALLEETSAKLSGAAAEQGRALNRRIEITLVPNLEDLPM